MPYAFENHHTPLPIEKDRRRKLTLQQKESIRTSPATVSNIQLAKEYGVSRRTIDFIRHPEKLAQNKLLRELRGGWKQYYDKDSHTDSMREHRRYKQSVLSDSDKLSP